MPVKTLTRAKTRLALPDEEREALAQAFAVDTLTALLGCPAVSDVLVVTSDPALVCRLRERPVHLVPDPGAGLTAAVHVGVRAATAWHPAARAVVVPADLPCLRPDDVTQVLLAARGSDGAFVPDRSGTGTTLLVHPCGPAMVARYGPGSAVRHRSSGLVPLTAVPAPTRHDVDTLEDLDAAAALGTGAETTAVVAALTPRWRTSR